jgi:hypothetical protein
LTLQGEYSLPVGAGETGAVDDQPGALQPGGGVMESFDLFRQV